MGDDNRRVYLKILLLYTQNNLPVGVLWHVIRVKTIQVWLLLSMVTVINPITLKDYLSKHPRNTGQSIYS